MVPVVARTPFARRPPHPARGGTAVTRWARRRAAGGARRLLTALLVAGCAPPAGGAPPPALPAVYVANAGGGTVTQHDGGSGRRVGPPLPAGPAPARLAAGAD